MQSIKRMLGFRLSSETFAGNVACIACSAGGLLTIVLGIRKLNTLVLTDKEIFFGVLLVLTLGLLIAVVGMIALLLGHIEDMVRRQRHSPTAQP